MKAAAIAMLALAAFSTTVTAGQSVRGHVRKDGTYVQPHYRSSPDSQRWNNYGAQGNTNPFTGERGTQRHEFSNPPAYGPQQPYNQRRRN